ncbi:hypothetical protein SELMODRAFT_416782 [Selaginella moellendorffii]|uniref:Pentacotripeptide-repeat region of PRORP domain-containing protein n=1 Tax=Selaginella moellendorffii TaxID=88036 RepID=D8S0E3_SELML|nr:hypothetical protein SELMODRAFT_416782 [Selaginella moellendorffii]
MITYSHGIFSGLWVKVKGLRGFFSASAREPAFYLDRAGGFFLFVRHHTDGAVTQSVFSPFKSVRLGKQKGHLWRTRKTLSRETQLVVSDLVRHKSEPERVSSIIKTKVSRLLKLDLFGALRELQRQLEGELALKVFYEIKKEEWYTPDILQYAKMLGCLAKAGLTSQAEKLFEEMQSVDGLEPELNTYTEYLRSLIFSRQVDKVHATVREMKEQGCPPDLVVYKVLWVGLNAVHKPKDAEFYRNELLEAQTRRQHERLPVEEIEVVPGRKVCKRALGTTTELLKVSCVGDHLGCDCVGVGASHASFILMDKEAIICSGH